MLHSGHNWWFLVLCDLEIWQMILKINRTPLLYYLKLCVHHFKAISSALKLKLKSGNTQVGSKSAIFFTTSPRNLTDDLEKNRAALLYCVKHCASKKVISAFILEWQSGKAQFRSKSAIFSPMWPWNLMDDLKKTIGHLSYVISSFVHNFIAICKFKLELQSGNG